MDISKCKTKVVIISEPGSGGVKRHVLDLLNNIDTDIFKVYFFYSTKRADKDYLDKINLLNKKLTALKIEALQKPISVTKDFLALVNIIKLIKNIRPDVVHCHSSKAGVLGRIAAKWCGVKKVFYTPHAYAFQNSKLSYLNRITYIFIEKYLSRFCTYKTINVSNGEKIEAINNDIDIDKKFIVIHNGVDKNLSKYNCLKTQYGFMENDFIVGCIGRLEEQKNPLLFLKIVKLVKEKGIDVKFLWIGNGELKKICENYIKQNKLNDICIILPFSSETEKLLTCFDVFISTSLYEGYPYTLLDASINNIPIIATNITGNNEIVDNEVNGFLYKNDDVKEVVKYIKNIKESRYNFRFNKIDGVSKMVKNIQMLYRG